MYVEFNRSTSEYRLQLKKHWVINCAPPTRTLGFENDVDCLCQEKLGLWEDGPKGVVADRVNTFPLHVALATSVEGAFSTQALFLRPPSLPGKTLHSQKGEGGKN